MNMKSCKTLRIVALALILAILLPCMPALAESYSAAVMDKKGMKVYTDAGLENLYATLSRYSIVTVKAVSSGVAKIDHQGTVLYADLDDLTAVKDFATPAEINQKTRVYEEPDALSRSTLIKKGTEVYILATNNGWSMIEKDGNVGYVSEQDLDIDEDDPFAGGSDLDPNDNNSALSGSDGVVIETIEAVVTDAKLTVYKSASTSSKKLDTLKQGEEVTVYAYNASWAYVRVDGEYGFCALDGLKRASDSSENPFDSEASVPATVTAKSVTVYESASSSSKKLGTLKKGAEVNLVKSAAGWAYIELNGNYGYCDSDAITESAAILPDTDGDVIDGKSPYGTCTVITASADYYSSKSTSKKLGTLSMGDTLSFYGYDSKWILVGVNGSFAYMQRKTLSADSYTELKNEDSGTAVLDMEKALLKLGYLDEVPSANYSAATVNALKRLQAACGMENTGVADIGTLRVLYSGNAPVSPILNSSFTKGDNNSSVQRIQARLYALGYLSLSSSVDGDYGNNTASAIRLFQKTAGGTETGEADSKTIRALYSVDAPSLPSGTKAADAVSSSSSNSSSVDSNLSSNVSEYVSGMSNAQKLEYVIYIAQQQMGKKYVFGSAGTATFDCSGLTLYCFKQIGIKLSHSAYGEGYNEKWRKISSISSMKRGDLVFLNTISDGDLSDHTGIYLGSGKFIHASSGAGKVIVSDLTSGYYNRVFSWGRRVLET